MPSTKNYSWEIYDLLGKGSFGSVYKGQAKTDSNKYVAIKTFRYTTKFYREREATVMRMNTHKNIVKFIAIEDNEWTAAQTLIMEYCDGGNLQTLIDSEKTGLSPEQFRVFFHDFIDGFEYLSRKNIVHGDIKPANILMSIHNGMNVFKIADFGAARVLRPGERFTSLYGTVEYLHPDILSNFYEHTLAKRPSKKHFGELHELWSVAATFYESATATLPFNPINGRVFRTEN